MSFSAMGASPSPAFKSRSTARSAFDHSVDRGRVAPLGGYCSPPGFGSAPLKTADRPNAYWRFSNRPPCLENNASTIGPSPDGLMTSLAVAGSKRERSTGRRQDAGHAAPGCSVASVMEGARPVRTGVEVSTAVGVRMTGHEAAVVARREAAEANPRRMLRPGTPAGADGAKRGGFITGNGLLCHHTPRPSQKNMTTFAFEDAAPPASPRRPASAMLRYASPYRPSDTRAANVAQPETLPLDYDLRNAGRNKVQRFNDSRRFEASLDGIINPKPTPPPPPYKLQSPFARDD